MVQKQDAEFEGAISILCNKTELENEQTTNKAIKLKKFKMGKQHNFPLEGNRVYTVSSFCTVQFCSIV